NGFGREVSSMVVRGGSWQVCTGDHFSGRCRVVREGEYPTLGWLNDRIVSVKFLGDDQNVARYDNWDTKRDARDTRDERRNDRPRSEANAYGEKDYRNNESNRYNDNNRYD